MENKNFEYKNMEDAPPYYDNNEAILWSGTYNTCLDRTNAKGIYEAGKSVVNWLREPQKKESISELKDLKILIENLETELKKAESPQE